MIHREPEIWIALKTSTDLFVLIMFNSTVVNLFPIITTSWWLMNKRCGILIPYKTWQPHGRHLIHCRVSPGCSRVYCSSTLVKCWQISVCRFLFYCMLAQQTSMQILSSVCRRVNISKFKYLRVPRIRSHWNYNNIEALEDNLTQLHLVSHYDVRLLLLERKVWVYSVVKTKRNVRLHCEALQPETQVAFV